MGSSFNIAAGITLDGEREFKQAVTNVNKSLGLMKSEMNLLKATYEGNANSLEALKAKDAAYQKQMELQKQKVEAITKGLENARESHDKLGTSLEAVKKRYEEATKKMDELKESSETSSEELENQQKAIDELSDAVKLGEKNLEKSENRIKDWEKQLNIAQTQVVKLSGEVNKNAAYMEEAEKSTDNCATSIDKFGKEIENTKPEVIGLGDLIKANLISDAIIKGIGALVSGIRDIATSAIGVGSNFEASMSQVAATMGMTVEQIQAGSEEYELLARAAKECGETTKYSASQAGEALNYLALAGYDATKATEALPKVLDLAAAGGMELAAASDLATDSAAALNLSVSELDTHIDQMAKTSQKSNTSVAQLGEAQLQCAGVIASTGQSLSTMNAELGILANNGIKGAEGGTKLRNILLSLAAPTDTAAVAMERLGLEVADGEGNIRNLNDIMTDLNTSLDGMSQSERTNIISTIFNKTDISGVNALLKGTGEEFDNLVKELEDCEGAAADMAKTMNDNLKGDVVQLGSAVEGLGIRVYETFDKTFRLAVKKATESVGSLSREMDGGKLGRALEGLAESFGDLAVDVIGFAQDALPVLVDGLSWLIDNRDLIASAAAGIGAALATQKVISIVDGAYKGYQKLKEALLAAEGAQKLLNLAQIASPMGALAAAVAAVGVALATAYILNMDKAKTSTDLFVESTEEMVKGHESIYSSIEKNNEKRKEERESIEAEYGALKLLSDNLFELAEKENKTNVEKAQMKFLVDELNKSMPILNLTMDEETGILNKQRGEVENLISAKLELYKVEAARGDLTEIAKDQYEAEKALAEAMERKKEAESILAQAEKDLIENQKEMNRLALEGVGITGKSADELFKYENNVVGARKALENIDADIEAANQKIAECGEEFEKTSKYVADFEINGTASAESFGGSVRQMSSVAVEELERLREEYRETWEEADKTVNSQIGLFKEFAVEIELTNEEILENLQSQISGMRDWSANMDELARRGIDEGLLLRLRDMGPESAKYVSGLVTMSDEEITKLNALWNEKMEVANLVKDEMAEAKTGYNKALEDIKAEANKLPEEMNKIGSNTISSWKSAIDSKTPDLISAYRNAATQATTAINRALQIHSPSRVFKGIAKFTMEGWESGVMENESLVTTAYEKAAKEATEAIDRSAFIDPYEINAALSTVGKPEIKSENQGINDITSMLKQFSFPIQTETNGLTENMLYSAFRRALSEVSIKQNGTDIIGNLVGRNREFKTRTKRNLLEV